MKEIKRNPMTNKNHSKENIYVAKTQRVVVDGAMAIQKSLSKCF